MNSFANKPHKHRSTLIRWMFVMAAMPILLSFVLCGALTYRELSARQAVREELARLRNTGQPVDNESMAAWFQAHSSDEGTAAWSEILGLVSNNWAYETAGVLPIVGTKKLPVDLAPGGNWPEEARVAEFLAESKLVIELINKAAEYPTPVWQPMHFEGILTLLPELGESRSILRLLQLEVEHAGYFRQPDRALKALTSMQGVAKAFDWKLCQFSEIVFMAHREIHQATIRRTLGADVWRAEHIAELMNQVSQPIDVVEHWRQSMSGERGLLLSVLERPKQFAEEWTAGNVAAAWILLTPSAKLNYLKFVNDFGQIPVAGIVGLARRAKAFQAKLDPANSAGIFASDVILLTRVIMPAIESYAAAFEKAELIRRLTLTSLGIKRFQLEQGRWPKQLSELEQVGLVPSDWTALDVGEFGYQVDGKQVRVWGYDRLKETAISPTPPTILNPDDVDKYWYATTIR